MRVAGGKDEEKRKLNDIYNVRVFLGSVSCQEELLNLMWLRCE